ncbi:hypothetical protein [Algiphilus sp.]|uniref:hypothetical protein n=1 Tax=Algiphilus sp. TaxID=1872431 RepID=UPI003BAA2A9D
MIQDEFLQMCPYCGDQPFLMRHPAGYFYECCGVMGSFPLVSDEETARKEWNQHADFDPEQEQDQ